MVRSGKGQISIVTAIKFALYILMFIGLFVINVFLLRLKFCDKENCRRTLVYCIVFCIV